MRGQHRAADVPPDVALLVEHGRCEAIEPESAAARPVHRFRDAAPRSLSMTLFSRDAQWVRAWSPISMPI